MNPASLTLLAGIFAIGLAGCSDKPSHDHSDHDHSSHQHGEHDKKTSIDAKLIESYPLDVCVVSDEKLGDHGKPIDMMHDGKLVRLCCKSCVKDFNKNPTKYLSKIYKE